MGKSNKTLWYDFCINTNKIKICVDLRNLRIKTANKKLMRKKTAIVFVVDLSVAAILFFCALPQLWSQQTPLSRTEPLQFETIARHPHDPKAYTQGLFYEDGFLYEGTGHYGRSSLRKVEPTTGKAVMQVSLPQKYFAEGIERVGDKIFQLTWKEGVCLIYDKTTFKFLGQFAYSGEGWGLTFDGEHLIFSDGSNELRFLDPSTFKQKRSVKVTERQTKTKKTVPIRNLNELEYIRGEVWANVWQTPHIVRIDPKNGNVIGWIDFSAFVPAELKEELLGRFGNRDRVLNGIAFDPATNRVFITGKEWPILYELRIVDPK